MARRKTDAQGSAHHNDRRTRRARVRPRRRRAVVEEVDLDRVPHPFADTLRQSAAQVV